MKRSSNHIVDLDLTSFIDILFAILICFIFMNSLKNGSSEEVVITTNPEQTDMVSMVLLVEYDENIVENRTIRMESDQEIEFAEFALLEGENEAAYETLKDELVRVINATEPDVPILLSIYEDRILYRDHKRIEEITDELKLENSNFYTKWKRYNSTLDNTENNNE